MQESYFEVHSNVSNGPGQCELLVTNQTVGFTDALWISQKMWMALGNAQNLWHTVHHAVRAGRPYAALYKAAKHMMEVSGDDKSSFGLFLEASKLVCMCVLG